MLTIKEQRHIDRSLHLFLETDPSFDAVAFVGFVQAIAWQVHWATSTNQLGSVAHLLEPTYGEYLEYNSTEWTSPVTDFVGAELLALSNDHGSDHATVRLLARGSSSPNPFVERWELQRPLHDRTTDNSCPACSALADRNEAGLCGACQLPVRGVSGTWRVHRIKPGEGPTRTFWATVAAAWTAGRSGGGSGDGGGCGSSCGGGCGGGGCGG